MCISVCKHTYLPACMFKLYVALRCVGVACACVHVCVCLCGVVCCGVVVLWCCGVVVLWCCCVVLCCVVLCCVVCVCVCVCVINYINKRNTTARTYSSGLIKITHPGLQCVFRRLTHVREPENRKQPREQTQEGLTCHAQCAGLLACTLYIKLYTDLLGVVGVGAGLASYHSSLRGHSGANAGQLVQVRRHRDRMMQRVVYYGATIPHGCRQETVD